MATDFQTKARKALGIDPETGKVEKVPPYKPDPEAKDVLPWIMKLFELGGGESTPNMTAAGKAYSRGPVAIPGYLLDRTMEDPLWWQGSSSPVSADPAPAESGVIPASAPGQQSPPAVGPGAASDAPSPGHPAIPMPTPRPAGGIAPAPAPSMPPSLAPSMPPAPQPSTPPAPVESTPPAPVDPEASPVDQYTPQIQKLLDRLMKDTENREPTSFWDRLPNILAAAGAATLMNSDKSKGWPQALGSGIAAGAAQNNELRKEELIDENKGDQTTSRLLATLIGMQNNQIQQRSLDEYRRALTGNQQATRDLEEKKLGMQQRNNESDAAYKARMATVAEQEAAIKRDAETREATAEKAGKSGATPQQIKVYEYLRKPREEGGLAMPEERATSIAFGAKSDIEERRVQLTKLLLEAVSGGINDPKKAYEEAGRMLGIGEASAPKGTLNEATVKAQYPGAKLVNYKDGRQRWVVYSPDGKPLGEVPGQ